MRITEAPTSCLCGWVGTVGECEPDIDGDGNLGCPKCGAMIVNTYEDQPPSAGVGRDA